MNVSAPRNPTLDSSESQRRDAEVLVQRHHVRPRAVYRRQQDKRITRRKKLHVALLRELLPVAGFTNALVASASIIDPLPATMFSPAPVELCQPCAATAPSGSIKGRSVRHLTAASTFGDGGYGFFRVELDQSPESSAARRARYA